MNTRSIPAFALSATLHALVVLLWNALGTPPTGAKAAEKAIEVFDATPPEDSRYPGLNPVEPWENWTLPTDGQPSPISIGTFTFDVTRIADHADVLFPFLTPGVSLEHFTFAPPRHADDHLDNPFPAAVDRSHAVTATPPLELSESALQAMVDHSWSRHDRWHTFQSIKELSGIHDGDAGTLPALLQAYREQNAFQPYTDTTIRDPRLWTELELAADHVNFIGFIRQYIADHPSTKATTELLFLLDRLALAERNTLTTVLETQPATQLDWTRKANRNAYDLFMKIQWFYVRKLDRMELESADAITEYFDKSRLAILTAILRSTPSGYRSNDARFLIGAIYWREHKPEEALRSWQEITTIDNSDSYAVTYADILRAIASHPHANLGGMLRDGELNASIEQVLDAEHGRWVVFSFNRLRQFGYGFDTY